MITTTPHLLMVVASCLCLNEGKGGEDNDRGHSGGTMYQRHTYYTMRSIGVSSCSFMGGTVVEGGIAALLPLLRMDSIFLELLTSLTVAFCKDKASLLGLWTANTAR